VFLTGCALGQCHGRQARSEVNVACGLSARLAVPHTGTLVGIAAAKLPVKTRLGVALEGQGIPRPRWAEEPSTPLVLGIEPEDPAQVPLTLDMGENLVIGHTMVSFGRNRDNAREVIPVPLALVRRGAPWSKAGWPVVEVAPMGLDWSCARRVAPCGVDTADAGLCAVIAIGDHVTPVTQGMRRAPLGHLLQIALDPCGLWGGGFAGGGVCWTWRE
jgi:hypothetical protein